MTLKKTFKKTSYSVLQDLARTCKDAETRELAHAELNRRHARERKWREKSIARAKREQAPSPVLVSAVY